MPKPTVLILTEAGPGVGLGHVTRCAHLASALRRAGADVWAVPERPTAATGFLRARGIFTDSPPEADIGIVDLMRWDEALVGNLADRTRCLVAIAGAGQPAIVSGLVDLVVYQTGWVSPSSTGNNVVGDRIQLDVGALFGTDYLILGPDYAPPLVRGRGLSLRGKDVLVCFGEGIPADYVARVVRELEKSDLTGTIVVPPYLEDVGATKMEVVFAPDGLATLQRTHAIQVGSIGMSTYEALAAGCYPITVGRSEDHVATGAKLASLGMGFCAGRYDQVSHLFLASLTQVILPAAQVLVGRAPVIDGLGADRVAKQILELVR